uniref:MFS domain-containing protein n=1 Tax=Macrostomum lignano TaxID=282301 RepID=A0A1I8IYZ5_9PLAT
LQLSRKSGSRSLEAAAPEERNSAMPAAASASGASIRRSRRNEFCCCGPGRKRYLIALLCSLGLTVVIGMRAEMVAIMDYLNKRSASNSSSAAVVAAASAASASAATSSTVHPAGEPVVGKPGGSGSNGMFQPSTHRPMPWQNMANDLIENSLFIGYLVASPIGGYLTVHHDSSLLLGCSVALTCGLNLFLPLVTQIAADISASIAIIVLLRLLQGLAEGCLVPAVFGTLRFWGPETERSSLLCSAVIGVSLGPLIGLPVCQEIENAWGWAVVFYIYANIGLIWCIFWWRLIDEKPPKDQRLGKRERQYLETAVKKKVLYADRRIRVPWKEIFKSRPVYAIFFTYAADDWTFQISSVCMQSYYHQMYNTDIARTIFLLSFPFLARSLFVPIGGFLADFIKLKTSLNWTAIRKLFAGLGFGLKAFFFVALGFANDAVVATILLSLALGFSGLAVAGYAVNVMELAPNFCGLVMGFANSISTFT